MLKAGDSIKFMNGDEITKINIPEFSKEFSAGEETHTVSCSVRADSLRFTIKIIPLLF